VPTYQCIVASDEKRLQRTIRATDLLDALDQLPDGEQLLSYRELRGEDDCWASLISREQMSLFIESLANCLRSGIPVREALRAVGRDASLPGLRQVGRHLAAAVDSGFLLSEAMEELSGVFSPAYCALVRAAERAGTLPEALSDLAESRRTLSQLARRVATSLAYPAVVASFALLVISFVLVYIVPRQFWLLKDLGIKDMPFSTSVLYWASTHLGVFLSGFLVLAACFGIILLSWTTARQGKVALDYYKVRLPGVGLILQHLTLARFYSTLALLTRHGMPLPQALEEAAEVAGNSIFAASIQRAVDRIYQGERVADALNEVEVIPEQSLSQIRVAEAEGDLTPVLQEQASAFFDKAQLQAAGYCAIVEPAVVLLLALFVGWTVVGMFSPVITVISSLTAAR